MPIGIAEEHESLRATARRWLEQHCPPSVPRAALEAPSDLDAELWKGIAAQGWLGLHVDERHGGQGYGLLELAVVVEEAGRSVVPGPLLPTTIVAALVAEGGGDALKDELLPQLASGDAIGAVALAPASVESDGAVLRGEAGVVLSAQDATVLVLPALDGAGTEQWWVIDAGAAVVEPAPSFDPTRRSARVRLDGAVADRARRLHITGARVRDLAATLAAAEASGGAAWCLDTATAYAKVREQFGRPIGQFQAVKHKLADMLVAVEQATASAYDAALAAGDDVGGDVSAAVAGATAPEAFARCAKDCIQTLGGIGFTWEHDAHMYLRRAMVLRQFVGGTTAWRRTLAARAIAGSRRTLHAELPESAAAYRAEVRAFLDDLKQADKTEWRARMADGGYLAPHWPAPWGRDAGPAEQLVIDEEFSAAHVRRPHLQIGAWAIPTLITHGTPQQQERFIPPTLRGELSWCQLFSEPGAGSDLASLTTKASRTDGGWLLTGQKVWTTMAREADWGICIARTNPSAPKHNGITYFLVDMRSEGIDVRPLRELTGLAMFNEVFLSDVFVPDDCVVGDVDDGWRLARNTLANERVSMAQGSSFGSGLEGLAALFAERGADDAASLAHLGMLAAEAQTLAVLGYRTTLRALSGADPGPEASVRKLVSVEHDQRVQETGLTMLGTDAMATDGGDAERWSYGFLAGRCLTIAGGTSEVQRNVIAERILGLPRDP